MNTYVLFDKYYKGGVVGGTHSDNRRRQKSS